MTLTMALTGCTTPETPNATQTQDLPQTHPTPTPPTGEELYEHAKRIYLEIHSETTRLEREGGADLLPPSIARYATGQYADELGLYFKDWKEQGNTPLPGDTELVWIRQHNKARNGSAIAIQACLDATSTGLRDKNGRKTTGGIVAEQVYFKYFDGELLGFEITYTERQSC